MTYFNPKIYNKQNLKESDRKELEFYKELFYSAVENALENRSFNSTGSNIIDAAIEEIVKDFSKDLKHNIGVKLQDVVVSMIDSYEDKAGVEEVENPETFFYKEDCDEEECS